MLDTVRLESPELPPEVLERVTEQLQTRKGVDNPTGDVLYEFTSGQLRGSFDHQIHIEVRRSEKVAVPVPRGNMQAGKAKQVFVDTPCSKVIIEGSVHKAIQGVNIAHGPEDFQAACRWFTDTVSSRLGVPWPDGLLWEPTRVDWAECWDMGSFAACQEFMHTLCLSKFPRRKAPQIHPGESFMFPGSTTTVKGYLKGPEFAAHDRKRLGSVLRAEEIEMLQDMANVIIRSEVEVKSKKLKADFGGKPLVSHVTADYLRRIHDGEILRVIRESEQEMEMVRRTRDVQARLYDVYGQAIGAHLFGTWMKLSACGEDSVRGTISRTSFYRQRKLLQDAGISWFGSDVQIVTSAIPEGFSLRRSDPRRLTGESDTVRMALMPYRTVAA